MPRKTEREDVLRLYERGYDVPLEFLEHIQRQKYKEEGLAQVWQCPNSHIYKAPIPVKASRCHCGKTMKRIWSRRGE